MDYAQQMQQTTTNFQQRTANTTQQSQFGQQTTTTPRPFTGQGQSPMRPETTEINAKLEEFQELINAQKNKFDRFIGLNQTRMSALEKEVSELREELKQKSVLLEKYQEKETVSKSREALFDRKDRPPVDQPIDRNHVAPSQVQIGNIFNCNGKKFK